MKKNNKGFSLIELLIVVAIILIIAAIAIPNLLRSKIAANQASAVGSLRTIDTSEVAYSTTYNIGYSANLADLGGTASACSTGAPTSTAACLIDSDLAGGTKSGYTVAETGAGASGTVLETFTATAVPGTIGQSGQDGYFTDQSDVIRYTTNGTAPTIASPALGG